VFETLLPPCKVRDSDGKQVVRGASTRDVDQSAIPPGDRFARRLTVAAMRHTIRPRGCSITVAGSTVHDVVATVALGATIRADATRGTRTSYHCWRYSSLRSGMPLTGISAA